MEEQELINEIEKEISKLNELITKAESMGLEIIINQYYTGVYAGNMTKSHLGFTAKKWLTSNYVAPTGGFN